MALIKRKNKKDGTALVQKKKEKITYISGGEGFIKWVNEHVRISIYIDGVAVWCPMAKLPRKINPTTGRCSMGMWEEQQKLAKRALQMKDGKFIHRLIALCWMRGEGKCEKKGTKVIMFDGSVKKVEDVKIGDLLMGDDNTPREVLSLSSGKEELFDVIPNRGETLTVTRNHILSLKTRCMLRRRARKKPGGIDPHENEVIDISLNDYMKESKYFKRKYLLFRVPLNFPFKEVKIDPYYLGIWLGDGSSGYTSVTTMDKEVVDYLQGYATKLGLKLTIGGVKKNTDGTSNKAKTYRIVGERSGIGGTNTLLNLLREYDLINNKHVPLVYKANSREVRLQVLAGLIDSDGYLNRNSYQIIQKNKGLAEDIAFLARSLGFHANIKKRTREIKSIDFSGEYYGIGISGDCSIIPVRIPRKKASPRKVEKDILVTTIKEVHSAGIREYYGFTLTGNGRYVRGDFTVTHNSLFVCLIQLWKFFNFPKQQIMLGANSKDQVKFVHFDILRDIILNSPKLLSIVGRRNIQEKEIRLKDKFGNVVSIIRSISSFSGIVSNITGYTFSEIFDMKNPKFFTQLDGSIRNIPNALGVIDSTVSTKDHILYRLYTAFTNSADPTIFFSYRCSRTARHQDYWNPEMTQVQLNSYQTKFPPAEFDMYFKNVWESATHKMFSSAEVKAMRYIGYMGSLGEQQKIIDVITRDDKRLEAAEARSPSNVQVVDGDTNLIHFSGRETTLYQDIIPISDLYSLISEHRHPKMCSLEELQKIGDTYNTDFSILVGIDRADPMKKDLTRGARTILTVLAKCLPGSKDNPMMYMGTNSVPNYMYFVLHFVHIEQSDIETIKSVVEDCIDEYDGVDSLCTERWGMWDVGPWCEDNEIHFEPVSPSYDKQRDSFSELYTLVKRGRLKCPETCVPGHKEQDIVVEEFQMFDHNPATKYYGSPEKGDRFGVQDDSIFSIGWGIYGGRFLNTEHFRSRGGKTSLGEFHKNTNLVGNYKHVI